MPRLSAMRSVPLLSRFARAGLVTQRQTFVRRCHGGMAEAIITLRQGACV